MLPGSSIGNAIAPDDLQWLREVHDRIGKILARHADASPAATALAPEEVWISVAVAATRAGVSKDCVRKWIKQKRFNCQPNGGRWQIDPRTLSAFLRRE